MVPIHGGFCLHLHLLERVSRSPFTRIGIVLRFSVLAQRMIFPFTITANTPVEVDSLLWEPSSRAPICHLLN